MEMELQIRVSGVDEDEIDEIDVGVVVRQGFPLVATSRYSKAAADAGELMVCAAGDLVMRGNTAWHTDSVYP